MAAFQPGAAATAGAIQHLAAPTDETAHFSQEAALAHLIATPGPSWDAEGPEQLAVMQQIGRGSPWFAPLRDPTWN